ncbi:hypothetical protein SESBI_24064 [Sesbania bispinosa]|nr:hypothetical protein SESBI_24064 [Sesbania bispinosa]
MAEEVEALKSERGDLRVSINALKEEIRGLHFKNSSMQIESRTLKGLLASILALVLARYFMTM